MKLVLALLLLPQQNYTQRGFMESQAALFPQTAANDSGRAVGDVLLRYEGFLELSPRLQLTGGVDLRTDTHHQTERRLDVSVLDRKLQRPLLSIRRLSAQYHRSGFTLEAGKQLIRWGKTDLVNPTDRFAPRDFLTVMDEEFLPISAIRGTYERGSETIDVVWSGTFTPSRLPLQSQRWVVLPPGSPVLPVVRLIPSASQTGIRWSHVGFVEFSAAYYSGFDHLPSFELNASQSGIRQFYPELKMAGGDFAVPLPWLTLKSEAAYFNTPDDDIDNYVRYVVQLERQSGEWFFVGGYGGEFVTSEGAQTADFNPDRGRTRTILGRAGYTIDTNRSVAVEGAVRENGNGVWVRTEYSQAFGQHWRFTAGFTLIRGEPGDFLGQYRRNSHGLLAVRYSF